MNAQVKDERIDFRLAGDIKATMQQAAKLVGKSLSEFLIDYGQRAASEILTDRKLFVLNAEQAKAFESAMNNPLPANDKLVSLMSKKSVFE
ncbi:MAG: DUF1778 domain-containing protein [Mariprofundaceae bacterium]|nr:DUF1778 domain-containing protein [Mariprofundaceae bacterium]